MKSFTKKQKVANQILYCRLSVANISAYRSVIYLHQSVTKRWSYKIQKLTSQSREGQAKRVSKIAQVSMQWPKSQKAWPIIVWVWRVNKKRLNDMSETGQRHQQSKKQVGSVKRSNQASPPGSISGRSETGRGGKSFARASQRTVLERVRVITWLMTQRTLVAA